LCLLFACGGDGSSHSPDPLSAEEAEDLCRSACEHRVACGDEPTVESCMVRCVAQACVFRGDVASQIFGCQAELACGASTQMCEGQVNVARLPANTTFEQRCEARFAECGMDDGGYCVAGWHFYSVPLIESATLCFDEACDAIVMCQIEVIGGAVCE
jgi:hypothetical protein